MNTGSRDARQIARTDSKTVARRDSNGDPAAARPWVGTPIAAAVYECSLGVFPHGHIFRFRLRA
jgi:hypothetical protein